MRKGKILGQTKTIDSAGSRERGDRPLRLFVEDDCISLYAGCEAERVILGIAELSGDRSDRARDRDLISEYVGVKNSRFVGDEAWVRYEDKLRTRSNLLMRLHRSVIERVADAVLKRRTLQPAEVDALIKG